MKLKTTKRALGLSVLSLVLCFAMLIGTTFAWFTDSVTSENNIIHSGILRISMEWANGTEDPDAETTVWTDASTGAIFNYELWEPGYTDVKHIRIMNKDEDGVQSNLALQYKLSIVPTGTPSELAEVIDVYSVAPTADSDLQNMATQIETRDDMSKLTKLGTLQDILDDNGQIDISGIMLPTDTVNSLTIALKMQEEAGNEYQDLAIGSDFRIVLTATQYTYESDSFDNQYDAGAMPEDDEDNSYLTFTAQEAGSTVTPKFKSGSYEYSTDKSTWKVGANDGTTTITLANIGDKVYLRGTNCKTGIVYGWDSINQVSTQDRYTFSMTGKIAASGSVTSLTDGVGTDANVTLTDGCYVRMFDGCTALTTVPELPATTLTAECYYGMFAGCTGLTAVPTKLLPATALARDCYNEMFDGCTGLTATPELPATELKDRCYRMMFQGCTSLETVSAIKGTVRANGCYQQMFGACTKLRVITCKSTDEAKFLTIPADGCNAGARMFEETVYGDRSEFFTIEQWDSGTPIEGMSYKIASGCVVTIESISTEESPDVFDVVSGTEITTSDNEEKLIIAVGSYGSLEKPKGNITGWKCTQNGSDETIGVNGGSVTVTGDMYIKAEKEAPV